MDCLSQPTVVSCGPGTSGSGDSMRLFLESTEFMCAQPTVWDAERAARGCGEERQGNAELVWRMNASRRSCGSGGRPAVRLRKLSGGGTTTGL